MSEILENELFLGSINDATNYEFLEKHNIDAIICVADHCVINNVKEISVYHYVIADDYDCNISCHFNDIFKVIESHNNVLVHCVAGISRSPTIVIAYLMKYEKMNKENAIEWVKYKRPGSFSSLYNFDNVINSYEEYLKKKE